MLTLCMQLTIRINSIPSLITVCTMLADLKGSDNRMTTWGGIGNQNVVSLLKIHVFYDNIMVKIRFCSLKKYIFDIFFCRLGLDRCATNGSHGI